MILVGIGSNVAFRGYSTPGDTVAAALMALPTIGVEVAVASGWYESEPVPASTQPWFVNAVVVSGILVMVLVANLIVAKLPCTVPMRCPSGSKLTTV